MLLSDEDLEKLQPEVSQTPEGSAARILFDELVYLRKREKRKAEQDTLAALMRQEGFTIEEAKRVYSSLLDGKPFEYERVRCWQCEGRGQIDEPACMGVRWVRCPKCHGRATCSRIKIPT